MKAYLVGWLRAVCLWAADALDVVYEYFEAGPPEPPGAA
jgi:hypothetical protein